MKKIILSTAIILSIAFSSCAVEYDNNIIGASGNNDRSNESSVVNELYIYWDESSVVNESNWDEEIGKGRYAPIMVDFHVFLNAQEIVYDADWVFTGKITGISFEVIDRSTDLPPTDETKDDYRYLTSVYEVEVIESFKGNVPDYTRFKVYAGIANYREDEQRRIMEEGRVYNRENGIRLYYDYEDLKYDIGEFYLFALRQTDNDPVILTVAQSVYQLADPMRKHTFRCRKQDTEKVYYTGDFDDRYGPIISAKDIISEFGASKWNAFYGEWCKTDSVYNKTINE